MLLSYLVLIVPVLFLILKKYIKTASNAFNAGQLHNLYGARIPTPERIRED